MDLMRRTCSGSVRSTEILKIPVATREIPGVEGKDTWCQEENTSYQEEKYQVL